MRHSVLSCLLALGACTPSPNRTKPHDTSATPPVDPTETGQPSDPDETGTTDDTDETGTTPEPEPVVPAGTCAGPTRDHVAYSWNPVDDTSTTPGVLDVRQYRLREIGRQSDGTFDAAVWDPLVERLRTTPEGQRAIIVRADSLDVIPHAHPDDVPMYWDTGVAELAALLGDVADELLARGVTVDRVFHDFEWNFPDIRDTEETDQQSLRDTIVADPRYETEITPVFDRLTRALDGSAFPLTASLDEVAREHWTVVTYQYKRALLERKAAYYRTALYEPFITRFPDVQVSNYAFWDRGDLAMVPDLNGHTIHQVGVSGSNLHAGNRAALELYGRISPTNFTAFHNNPDPDTYPTTFENSRANAVRLAVRAAQSAAASAQSIDLWFSTKEWPGDTFAPTPLACGALWEDAGADCHDHWEESVYHSALLTNGALVLWSKAEKAPDSDARVQGVLDALNTLTGCDDRTPLGALNDGWSTHLLASGMRVEGWRIWRVGALQESPPPADWVSTADSGVEVYLEGEQIQFPDATVWPDQHGRQGVWVVQPVDAAMPTWTAADAP